MTIHLHTLVWNEEKILPYVLRHYSKFCAKMYFWDNGSTDSSLDVIKSYPNTIIKEYDSGGEFSDPVNAHIKNTGWKESRDEADWIIVTDCDEFIYHPDIINFLTACKNTGYTFLKPFWCEMVADEFPVGDGDIYDYVQYGFRIPDGKPSVFDPKKIIETNFGMGAHHADPTGDIVWHTADSLRCFHFKQMGADYVYNRYAMYKNRMSKINLAMRWGWHYQQEIDGIKKYIDDCKTNSVKVI